MASEQPPPEPSHDLWYQGGRLAEVLSEALMAVGIGNEALPLAISVLAEAEAASRSLRQEVERHESRLDEAAVHAGANLMQLQLAVAELQANREQLVEGGLADETMLRDLDLQIVTLETRIDEVKTVQDLENRIIIEDLSPERDRLVSGELRRQSAAERLIRLVLSLKPDPCPPELEEEFAELVALQEQM